MLEHGPSTYWRTRFGLRMSWAKETVCFSVVVGSGRLTYDGGSGEDFGISNYFGRSIIREKKCNTLALHRRDIE